MWTLLEQLSFERSRRPSAPSPFGGAARSEGSWDVIPVTDEEANMDQEKLAARIVEAAPDAVLFTDRRGAIRLWNAGAERIFGWTAAEAIGKSLDLIIPDRLRARHWQNWDRVMETGVTRYATEVLAVPALRKDGAALSIEFTIQLVRDEHGTILGPAAIVRDVTARFQREKELRAKVREFEGKLAAWKG
jgi:PAS domain S-box-containing protein